MKSVKIVIFVLVVLFVGFASFMLFSLRSKVVMLQTTVASHTKQLSGEEPSTLGSQVGTLTQFSLYSFPEQVKAFNVASANAAKK